MTFLHIFSCFDNNCHKSHKKKLNICEFTKINLNLLNFLTPLCVCMRMYWCGTNTVVLLI